MRDLGILVESMLRHLIVGDALGKICSKYTKQEVYSLYGGPIECLVKPIRRNSSQEWQKGAITDDTILTMIVTDSLIERCGFDRRDVARRFIMCDPKGGKQIKKLKENGNEDYIAVDGNTNGASIRVSPLVVTYRNLSQLTKNVVLLSNITHGDNEAVSAALFVAYALHQAINGEEISWDVIKKIVLEYYPIALDTKVRENLVSAFNLAKTTDPKDLPDLLEKEIGYYKESWSSIPTAIVLGANSTNNYETLKKIIHRNYPMGDLDSVASIAGSILGARNRDLKVEDISREIELINSFSIREYSNRLVELSRRINNGKIYCI